jgi:NhaP-type Na+/H+ or K+/H+ antiporter
VPDRYSNAAVVLTALVLGYAVVSGLVKRWYLAPALIFVLLEMMLGPYGFGVLRVADEIQLFTVLAQIALAVILFNQAAALDVFASVVSYRHAAGCSSDGSGRAASVPWCWG